MSPGEQRLDTALALSTSREASPEQLRAACHVLGPAAKELQACLRWAATQAVGVRGGGLSVPEMQQVMSAAARLEDWRHKRDQFLKGRRGG